MALSNQQVIAFVKRNPVSIGCVAFCLALGVFSFFRMDAIPLAETDLQDKNAQAERLRDNVKLSAQLKEQLDEVSEGVKVVESRLVHATDLATNLQFFYKIEADTGTKLVDLRQNPVVPPPKDSKQVYVGVPYAVTVQGDYPHLVEFLRRLESGARYCRVVSAAFNAKPATAQPGGEATGDAPLTLVMSLELLGVR